MHSKRIADPSTTDAEHDAIVLDLLLADHHGLWSTTELQHQVGDPVAVEDSLNRLHALGLIHRLEEFVFATRTAAHMHALPS